MPIKTATQIRREEIKAELWPADIAWTGDKPETGWFRAPRTLPLVLMLLSDKRISGKSDVGTGGATGRAAPLADNRALPGAERFRFCDQFHPLARLNGLRTVVIGKPLDLRDVENRVCLEEANVALDLFALLVLPGRRDLVAIDDLRPVLTFANMTAQL